MIKPAAVMLQTAIDDYVGLIYCDLEDREQTIQQLFTILNKEDFRFVAFYVVETNFNVDNNRLANIIDDLIADLKKGDK